MGIVCHCPNGHRIKVRDRLAGKRGLCPTCGAKFRIPLVAPRGPAMAAAADQPDLPDARFVPLDPAVVAALPRAVPWGTARAAAVPAEEDVDVATADADAAAAPADGQRQVPAVIAERSDLPWRIAFPGAEPSAPVDAAMLHDWLTSGQAEGTEVVWRADWAAWLPVREVFPEFFG